MDHARQFAAFAYANQQRCVTAADYAAGRPVHGFKRGPTLAALDRHVVHRVRLGRPARPDRSSRRASPAWTSTACSATTSRPRRRSSSACRSSWRSASPAATSAPTSSRPCGGAQHGQPGRGGRPVPSGQLHLRAAGLLQSSSSPPPKPSRGSVVALPASAGRTRPGWTHRAGFLALGRLETPRSTTTPTTPTTAPSPFGWEAGSDGHRWHRRTCSSVGDAARRRPGLSKPAGLSKVSYRAAPQRPSGRACWPPCPGRRSRHWPRCGPGTRTTLGRPARRLGRHSRRP